MFVTDRSCVGWTAADVVEQYGGRGGFEQRLSEEDQEQATEQVVSQNPQSQQLWQVICQWVWNLRIWLGRPEGAEVRVFELSPPVCVTAEEPPGEVVSGQPESAAALSWEGETSSFVCSQGVRLTEVSRLQDARDRLRVYQAPGRVCGDCEQTLACRGRLASLTAVGHMVMVREDPTRPPPPSGGGFVWRDVPARAWRGTLQRPLRLHRVELEALPATEPAQAVPPPLRTRAERRHQRRTWLSREQQNAATGTRWRIHLHGIPEHLCKWLLQTQPLVNGT